MIRKAVLGAFILLGIIALIFTTSSFVAKKRSNPRNEVVIHALSDPDGLNPYTSSDAHATQIMRNIFQTLLNYNMSDSSELIPVLAKQRPFIDVLPDKKGMEITYEIREDAVWDDGTPITAEDVVFSYKALFCPGVNSESNKNSLAFVSDVRTYPENPKKVTIVSEDVYALAEDATGVDVCIIPAQKYDPEKLLKKFKVSEIIKSNNAIVHNPSIKKFATQFNSSSFSQDVDKIVGSGAYYLEKWETGQKIVLVKKDNWWGEKHAVENLYFEAYPNKLIYLVVNDFKTAITALEDGKLDVAYITPIYEYLRLKKDRYVKENYNFSEPPMPVYAYLGLNTRDKILEDIKVRQALSMLVDVDYLLENILYSMGQRIVADINPANKEDYNNDIELYPHDIEKAISLLESAGWKDTDDDGILDKMIDGKRTPFLLVYSYNMGNPIRERVGLILQKDLSKVGIKMEIVSKDWSVYLDELKKQNVQMWYGSWIQDPRDNDLRQIWHTESRNGGSNYAAFGDKDSDKLIEKIMTELDPIKRSELYKEWQVLLHKEAPYIFLYTNTYRNVIHNRFTNLHEGIRYPGYWEAGFKLKQ
ncbi:MAG: hypothetical protein K1X55_01280 [Chitinophagales bacterium]|nr:hypothetical protein [Chitinophagales bacterium]